MSTDRIVLACSGGLDTSVAIGGMGEGTGAHGSTAEGDHQLAAERDLAAGGAS